MSPDLSAALWKTSRAKLSSRDSDVWSLVVETATSEDEVAQLEGKLGFPVHPKFTRLLLEVSRPAGFRWFLSYGTGFAEPFESNFSGDLHWSLSSRGSLIPTRMAGFWGIP